MEIEIELRKRGIAMRETLLLRRSEMLKQRSIGVRLHIIVKDLAQKYDVSERQIYYDWQKRDVWIPILLNLKNPLGFLCEIVSKHDELRRMAMFEFLKAPPGSTARCGLLRLIRDIDMDLIEIMPYRQIMLKIDRLEQVVIK